jgi:hypothetical protein
MNSKSDMAVHTGKPRLTVLALDGVALAVGISTTRAEQRSHPTTIAEPCFDAGPHDFDRCLPHDVSKPARVPEIISAAGFENYFREVVDLGGGANAGPQALGGLCNRYGLEMDLRSLVSRRKGTPPVLQRSSGGFIRQGDLLNRINLILAVQPCLQKDFCSRQTQIKSKSLAVPPHRGAYRDRHGRGAGCGGRGSVGRAT